MPLGNKCHVDAWIINESNKRSVHLPHLWEQNYCFPFFKSWLLQLVKKKEKKGGKKSMCDEPKPALAVSSPGQHHCRQAAAVAFLHLLTTHVNQIWICACEWRKSLSYDVGKLWNCVGGVNIFSLRYHAIFWLTFFFRAIFWHFLSNIKPNS